MEKINLVEILKNCPKGMKLDCTVYDNVTLEYVCKSNSLPICIRIQDRGTMFLSKYGQFHDESYCKCIIFPKGKTTWEGFIPPCKFKAGDVLVSEAGNIVLFSHIDSNNLVHYHCIIPTYGSFRIEENTSTGVGRYYDCVLANEQQIQRIYDKIKCSGYKYNQNTNTLEKLIKPKFKIGDVIKTVFKRYKYTVTKITDTHYTLEEVDDKFIYVQPISNQDNWELVPNKFNINTLKPFDKVLVRSSNNGKWGIDFFGGYSEGFYYTTGNCMYVQCIPYEGNEHLLGKTNDCDEYFKTWED